MTLMHVYNLALSFSCNFVLHSLYQEHLILQSNSRSIHNLIEDQFVCRNGEIFGWHNLKSKVIMYTNMNDKIQKNF